MATVIGLFSKDEHVQRSIDKLQEAGITRDKIKVLAFEDAVVDLLNGRQSAVITKYVGLGVLVGMTIFGLYELIGRICDCGIPIYGIRIELDTLALFIAVGAILSMLVGYFVGIERLKGSIRPYIWNVHQGSKVVAVQANDEQENTVINILHNENGAAIKTLETRASHFWHKASQHSY